MLCHRIKQFREYNNLSSQMLADMLGIDIETYNSFENGTEEPTIDIVHDLCRYYKVTVGEFYGYTPRLTLHSPDYEKPSVYDDAPVEDRILKMSDLSWDEAQLILYYRKLQEPAEDEIIKKILQKNAENQDD